MRTILILLGLALLGSCSQRAAEQNLESSQAPAAVQFEIMRLKDPSTGEIPSHLKMQLMQSYAANIQYKQKKIYPNRWTAVDDQFASLSVTRLQYDPNDPDTYYFCTGEGWQNADAARGAGVWKSEDAGASWYQLSSTTTSDFYYCQDLIIHPANSYIYVSTRARGIMRSTDGGNTWDEVLNEGNGAKTTHGTDLEIGPDGMIYACFGIFSTDGIYRSASGDAGTWEFIMNGLSLSNFHRIEMATSPSDPNRLYAARVRSSDRKVDSIYRSDNKGDSWYSVSLPGGNREFAKLQGWYDLILKVDPNDADVVALGGLNIWRSRDGGDSWEMLTDGSKNRDGSLPNVHVDQHEILFISSDTVLFGNDGGLYKSDNFTDDKPSFYNINKNYNVVQYYAVDMEPANVEGMVVGGTQDNGSNISMEFINQDFKELSWADGGFCAIDYQRPEIVYTTTQSRRILRTTNGILDTITNDQLVDDNTLFINPMIMDVNDPTTLYQGSNIGIWRLDNARTAGRSDWVKCTRSFGLITALAVSKSQPNRLMLGRSGSGVPYYVDNAKLSDENYIPQRADKNNELPDGYLNCIVIDPQDAAHVVLIYTNYGIESVFETKNGLDDDPDWVSCEGDLPDLPIRWGTFLNGSSEIFIAATELGLFYTMKLDGAQTVWQKYNGQIPNIRVDMITYQKSGTQLVVGTHGRGIYSGTVKVSGSALQFSFIERGPNNIGGRTRTIMMDPNDPSRKKFWAGSVSGGLWVTGNLDSIEHFNFASSELKVYPNPASDIIFLEFDLAKDDPYSVNIYNMSGQLLLTKSDAANTPVQLSVGHFAPGLYIVELKQGNQKIVKKLLVNP